MRYQFSEKVSRLDYNNAMDHIEQLKGLLNDNEVICDDRVEKYNVDWTGNYKGQSGVVVLPSSTEAVARVM